MKNHSDQRVPLGPEERKILPESKTQPDPELTAAGWERRFIAAGERAREAMELYTQLGFEVCAVPVQPSELEDGCEDCRAVSLLQFKTIYTRRKQGDQPDRPATTNL
ncbi:MAG: hypothetical protein LAO21_21025 [Acidobacteriia bacterium]|nr:hypothetical protein [Terriglobia bacterium]